MPYLQISTGQTAQGNLEYILWQLGLIYIYCGLYEFIFLLMFIHLCRQFYSSVIICAKNLMGVYPTPLLWPHKIYTIGIMPL